MAGARIIFLLAILMAPRAVPAYKLKYFNVLTNATVTISYPMEKGLATTALRFLSVTCTKNWGKRENKFPKCIEMFI